MAETITIQVPDSPEEREEVMTFLEAKGLLVRENKTAQPPDKPEPSRWAKLAQKFREDNYLGNGVGDVFRAGCKEFREGFVFKSERTDDPS